MKRWVVFIFDGHELLRYTLKGEAYGERQATIELLAYENGIPQEQIVAVEI